MKATISMESLWQTIGSLSLRNQKWLADKLIENIHAQEKENEEEYISKEDILAGIDRGLKDVAAGKTQPLDDFIKELERDAV